MHNLPNSPVLRLNLTNTVKLLTTFLSLVPQKDPDSIEKRIEKGQNPLGNCPTCNGAMWLNQEKYGTYIACK
ncbi:hypothetical protein NIES4101_62430 [Calothrix sp. NIES-4101]|nr:hypothetical protein NIES4101_62430 [Calothrix sp. NIES-4101]